MTWRLQKSAVSIAERMYCRLLGGRDGPRGGAASAEGLCICLLIKDTSIHDLMTYTIFLSHAWTKDEKERDVHERLRLVCLVR